ASTPPVPYPRLCRAQAVGRPHRPRAGAARRGGTDPARDRGTARPAARRPGAPARRARRRDRGDPHRAGGRRRVRSVAGRGHGHGAVMSPGDGPSTGALAVTRLPHIDHITASDTVLTPYAADTARMLF